MSRLILMMCFFYAALMWLNPSVSLPTLQFEGAVIPVNDTVCVINKQGNIRKKRNGLIKDIKPVSDAEMFLKVSNDWTEKETTTKLHQ